MDITVVASMHLELDLQLRLAIPEDLPKLEWYGQYTHFRRMFRLTYEDQCLGKRLMLIADLGGFPVGHVFILPGQPTPYKRNRYHTKEDEPVRRGYLYALRVMDHLHNRGIGTRLLQEAERLLVQHDNLWSTISVAKTNVGARRLYERHDYSVYADDPGKWQYVNHVGEIVQVNEPCWMLEKYLGLV